MAVTSVIVFVAITIITAGVGGLARSDLHFQKELPQQERDDNGGGYPSSGVGYASNPISNPGYVSSPPTDSGYSASAPTDGSIPIPTQAGSGSGSGSNSSTTDHTPHIPNVPIYGSTSTDHMPHITDVPIPGTGHGSCDFWSSHYGSWPDILSKMSSIALIFGEPASSMFPRSMTLMQALQNTESDAYSSLLKQASASILNAFAYKNFEFSPEDVKTLFAAALASPEAAADQALEFARANLGLK